MQYVADRGEFVIQTAAWDSMYVAWNTVHARYEGLERSGAWAGMGPLEAPWLVGTVRVFDSPLGVGLSAIETPIGTYVGSNAMGVNRTVVKSENNTYAVFERNQGSGVPKWQCELETGLWNSCAVRLPVPRSDAPALRQALEVGIAVRPKPPFTVSGTERRTPTVDLPLDETTHYNVIFADILCAVLVAPTGQVVKIVPAAY